MLASNSVDTNASTMDSSIPDFDKEKYVLCCSLNQPQTHFVLGTQRGYHVFAISPFQQKAHHNFDSQGTGAGIGITAMLFKTNILALVGGGKNPAFPNTKVILWDDQAKKELSDISSVDNKPVLNVLLQKNVIVILTEEKVTLFDFEMAQLGKSIDTTKNPLGLCSISADPNKMILAIPGITAGLVRLHLLSKDDNTSSSSPDDKKKFFPAHNNSLQALAFSKDGSKLATASEKGTLIRIFSTDTTEKIKEVRRGTTNSQIYSIAFSGDGNYIASYSSSGTLHVFYIGDGQNLNRNWGYLGVMGYVTNYFNQEYSFAEYQVKDGAMPGYVSFAPEDPRVVRLVLMTPRVTVYELTFDLAKGGEPTKISSSACDTFLNDAKKAK